MGNLIALSQIGKIYSGGTPTRNESIYWNGDIPWIKTTHIKGNRITFSDMDEFITQQGLENSSTKIAPLGTILIAMYGQGKTRGQVGFLEISASINQACCAVEVSANHCSEYVFQYLKSSYKKIRRLSNDGSQKNLNAKIIKDFKIYLPSYEEQKAIADILQTWDTAIEKTEALIDAKERQFGWLQNTLIRANSDEWPTKPLNSLSHIKKGQQLNRDTLDDSGDYPVWNGGITPSGYTDKSNTLANTITISEGGNSCGFVNFCKEDFWLGGHCYAIEKLNNNIDRNFLFFSLKANERRIMRLRVGSGLPNIQKKNIEKLQILFPEIAEQKRIANTLNTAKQEITLLQKLAEHYRTQKRGLMQKLLSGEWHMETK